jgi:hypothetical protein
MRKAACAQLALQELGKPENHHKYRGPYWAN